MYIGLRGGVASRRRGDLHHVKRSKQNRVNVWDLRPYKLYGRAFFTRGLIVVGGGAWTRIGFVERVICVCVNNV